MMRFLFSVVAFIFPIFAMAATNNNVSLIKACQRLESESQGRLGVAIIAGNKAKIMSYRGNERFSFCSTFKMMLVADILTMSESRRGLLNKIVHYKKITAYSPITQQHLLTGLSVKALCQAAIEYSDNTAANLLLKMAGGPLKVTLFARSMGDSQFRLDRIEPELNTAIPGDKRDTTTPNAMARSLEKIILGNALSDSKRNLLNGWMLHNQTGNARIRRGVPTNWQVADKTGTGDYGTTNDIAVIYPSNAKPFVLVIYFSQFKKDAPENEKLLSDVSKFVCLSRFDKIKA